MAARKTGTTSESVASLAAKVLAGYVPNRVEVLALAGTALAQATKKPAKR